MNSRAGTYRDIPGDGVVITRRVWRRQFDWLLVLIVAVVAAPQSTYDLVALNRYPSLLDVAFVCFFLVLGRIDLFALWKRGETVMQIEPGGIYWPGTYAEMVPWSAIRDVSLNQQTVCMTIVNGRRFGRASTLYYRMFAEQRKYAGDDRRCINCNAASMSAGDLRDLIAARSGGD